MFLKKLQNLPESQRKIILWLVVVVAGLILLFFWFRNFQEKLKSFPEENIKQKFQLQQKNQ